MFSACSTTAFTTDSLRAKVAFVKLNASLFKDTFFFAERNNAPTESSQDTIDRLATDSYQRGDYFASKSREKHFKIARV